MTYHNSQLDSREVHNSDYTELEAYLDGRMDSGEIERLNAQLHEAESYEEFLEACDYEDEDDWEDDYQPDLEQEYDDLYGYGPEFDSYDGYDEY